MRINDYEERHVRFATSHCDSVIKHTSFSVYLDRFSLERREAVAAMLAFDERARNLKSTPEEADSATDRRLEEYEEIELHPDGAPEEFAQKTIQKLFKDTSKENWDYLKVYEQFAKMYPRVTSGSPQDPWVSDSLIQSRTGSVSVPVESTAT